MRNDVSQTDWDRLVKYWLASYDSQAWSIFMELDRSAVGAKRPRPYEQGDIMLTYVRGEDGVPGQWTSGQRIVGEMFFDERDIYPSRSVAIPLGR